MKKFYLLMLTIFISGQIAAGDKPKEKPEEPKYQPLTLQESVALQIAKQIVSQFNLDQVKKADYSGAIQYFQELNVPQAIKSLIIDELINLAFINKADLLDEQIKNLEKKIAAITVATNRKERLEEKRNLQKKLFELESKFYNEFMLKLAKTRILTPKEVSDFLPDLLISLNKTINDLEKISLIKPNSIEAQILIRFFYDNPEVLENTIINAFQKADSSKLKNLFNLINVKQVVDLKHLKSELQKIAQEGGITKEIYPEIYAFLEKEIDIDLNKDEEE